MGSRRSTCGGWRLRPASPPAAAGNRLEALGRAYLSFAISHPGYFHAMFHGDANSSGPRETGLRAFHLLRACSLACSPPCRPDSNAWGGVEALAAQHLRARHSPDWLTRLFSLFAPCFSLLSPFFSLFRGDSGLENPLKTVCFQMVGQKWPSRAEQDHNREIIRP